MSKPKKLTIIPKAKRYEGQNNFLIGTAVSINYGSIIVVKGFMPESNCWNELDVICDMENNENYGITYNVKKIVATRKTMVSPTNSVDIIVGVMKLPKKLALDLSKEIFVNQKPIYFDAFVNILKKH